MSCNDIIILLLGAFIGFISSVGVILVERLLQYRGKVLLYYKKIILDDQKKPGFYNIPDNKVRFYLPISLEIQNTKNIPCVVRDVCILLCNNDIVVAKMHQAVKKINTSTYNNVSSSESQCFGADNESYSFVINGNSISKYYCVFYYSISKDDLKRISSNKDSLEYTNKKDLQFNTIKLRYFNEKNKEMIFPLQKIDGNWEIKCLDLDENWAIIKSK